MSEMTEGDGVKGNTNSLTSQRSKFVFTVNNYTPADEIIVKESIKNFGIRGGYGREVAPSTGTKHLQGFIILKKPMRWNQLEFPKGTHFETMKGTLKENINYISKEDKNYWGVGLPDPIRCIAEEDMYDWQKEVIKFIRENRYDDRTIIWYWDPEGCKGKSSLAKYICYYMGGVLLNGSGSDMKYALSVYYKEHQCLPHIVIIDLPRSSENTLDMKAIEEIKNGFFFSPKYESNMIIGNSPILIVFANHEPTEKIKNALSSDRWRIVAI